MKFVKNLFIAIGVILSVLLVIGIMVPDPQSQRGQITSSGSTSNNQDSSCQHPATPPPGSFGKSDIAAIAEASRGNEARFDRDYKSRTFYDCMHFDGLEREIIGAGWRLRLKASSRSWMADAVCLIEDSTARTLVDLNEGEMIHIQGTIQTTSIGTLQLKSCRIN